MSERDLPGGGRPAPPDEVTGPDAVPGVTPGVEDPEADYVEQHIAEGEEETEEPLPADDVLLEANEADVAEQHIAEPPYDEDHD